MGEILTEQEAERCNSWAAPRSEMWARLDRLYHSHEEIRRRERTLREALTEAAEWDRRARFSTYETERRSCISKCREVVRDAAAALAGTSPAADEPTQWRPIGERRWRDGAPPSSAEMYEVRRPAEPVVADPPRENDQWQ